ncbi:MAG: hypothetical protein AB7G93_19840 [Bdellovibrionales bacterium]
MVRGIRVLFCVGVMLPIAVHAEVLSNIRLLRRCYLQLTGSPLPDGDPLLARARQGETAGTLCGKLLDDVAFGSDGVLTTRSKVNENIVERFHKIHRDWIGKKWIGQADYINDVFFGTMDIYDGSEPSYYLTRALFGGVSYTTVLSGTGSLRAYRDLSSVAAYYQTGGIGRISRALVSGSTYYDSHTIDTVAKDFPSSDQDYTRVSTLLVPVGKLLGVQVDGDTGASSFVWTGGSTANATLNPDGIIVPQAIHAHYGGGAIGSIPYLLMNFGHPTSDFKTNGTTKLPRRWVQSIFEDFLCRSLPAVRDSDVGSYLRTDSTAGFRRQTSCLRCHTVMDQAALAARNLQPATFASRTAVPTMRSAATIARYRADQGPAGDQEFWPSKDVSNFHRQSPAGRLYFRSITGQLISRDVNGVEELGQALAATDDFYACAAKKYFQYFTGISIKLYDPLDPANAGLVNSMTSSEREARQFVIDLGRELKQTGSLKKLVKRILSSQIYRKADFGRLTGGEL